MKFGWLLLAAALLFALPQGSRAAEAADPLWHKSCAAGGDKPSCLVEQFAVVMPQNKVVLHVTLALVPHEQQVQLTITTPLGVALEPGLTMNIDDQKPLTLPFLRCTAQGCEAMAVLDKTATDRFVRGKTLTTRYIVQDKTPATVPIRLQGLGDALKSLAQ